MSAPGAAAAPAAGAAADGAPTAPAAAADAAVTTAPAPAAAALEAALGACPGRIAAELLRLTAGANRQSQQLCEFVLENVLVHEAAAQQLQASTSELVRDGQELLAVSRQLQPLLERLRHASAAAHELKALALAAGDAAAGGAPPPPPPPPPQQQQQQP